MPAIAFHQCRWRDRLDHAGLRSTIARTDLHGQHVPAERCGAIYCLYERGGRDAKSAYAPGLTLARFNLEWLSDGQDTLGRRSH